MSFNFKKSIRIKAGEQAQQLKIIKAGNPILLFQPANNRKLKEPKK